MTRLLQSQWTQPYSYVPDAHPDLIEQLRDRARKQSLFTLWLSEHWLAVVYGIGVGMLSVIVPAICTAWWVLQ